MAVVTPTDRPKSVRNRCVIDFSVALFALSLCPFDISVGVRAFVIGLSQISSFFSLFNYMITDLDRVLRMLQNFICAQVDIDIVPN